MLDVSLLGTGGTMPTEHRRLAALMLRHNGSCTLIDCGEGTQLSVRACGYAFKAIDRICLTHFHADHVSGLPGLLLSMGNEGRTAPLDIIGPTGTGNVVAALRVIAPELPFEIRITEQSGRTAVLKWADCTLTSFALRHTVPCRGYRLDISRAGRFDPELAKRNSVPMKVWNRLQHQGVAELDGVTYTAEQILGPARKGLRVVYATDTRPTPIISEMGTGADLMICEGMFGDSAKAARARESGHMTFAAAAELAARANPTQLWLTHFSPSMPAAMPFAHEAKAIFPETFIGYDGLTKELRFADEEPAEEAVSKKD